MTNRFTPTAVVLGEHNRASVSETTRTLTYSVIDIKIHPSYNPGTKENNIALLKLDSSINLSAVYPFIAPVCPPSSSTYTGRDAIVAG